MKALILILFSSSISFADCTAPDGAPIQTGESITLFTTQYKPRGSECIFSNRECLEEGTLSGNPKAVFIQCLDEKTCEHPFLPAPLTDKETVVAYKGPDAPCLKEVRVCDGETGILSGSYLNDICREKKKAAF